MRVPTDNNRKTGKLVITKNDLKIFFTLFIIYALFAHWMSWNENSRLDLTKAVVNEAQLTIDSYYHDTGDRALVNKHYYSVKPPGSSFFALPTYATWKFLYYNFFPADFVTNDFDSNQTLVGHWSGTVFYPVRLSFFNNTAQILIIVFCNSLIGALGVVFFYKIIDTFSVTKRSKYIATIAFALGSLFFAYGFVFYREQIATVILLITFYLANNYSDKKIIFFAGILGGISTFIAYMASIVALMIFLTGNRRKNFIPYFVGGILGVLPLFLYNFAILNNPFDFTMNHIDPIVYGYTGTAIWIRTSVQRMVGVMVQLLFLRYKGMFYYYPILVFSFFGLVKMYKKYKNLSILVSLTFLAFLLINSLRSGWTGGADFNVRFFLEITPFLFLPIAFAFDAIQKNKIIVIIFFSLMFVSMFNNFIGIQEIEDDLDREYTFNRTNLGKSTEIVPALENKIVNIGDFGDVLYTYYLSNTLENGPRSRIIEGLLTNPLQIDIRDIKQQPSTLNSFLSTPFGFLTFRVQTLPIALIIVATFLIWKKDISQLLGTKYYKYFRLFVFVALIPLVFTLQKTAYGENWSHFENALYSYRSMEQNSTIYFVSTDGENYSMNLTFFISSFDKPKTIDIQLGNDHQKVNISTIFPQWSIVTLKLKPLVGINMLKLSSPDECTIQKEISRDISQVRCLSFAVSLQDK